MDERTIDELTEETQQYKTALTQVVGGLLRDPGNEELLAAKTQLEEVLALTEQLLQRKQAAAKPPIEAASSVASATPDSLSPATSSSVSMRRHELTEVIPIPEHLKILPTDTPEEREAKKKKAHQIKKKNRMATINKETKLKQSTWKAFVSEKVCTWYQRIHQGSHTH
jgi:hypothetical protein